MKTWAISVPIHDRSLESDNFILAHPQEKIGLSNSGESNDIFTLMYSKSSMSVRFGYRIGDMNTMVKIFNMVLMRQVCSFLRTHIDSYVAHSAIAAFMRNNELRCLEREVDNILQNRKYRCLFYTIAHHFNDSYGVLTNIYSGYDLYPPQVDIFFVPPLAMYKYHGSGGRHRMLFYNASHVSQSSFRTYDFEKHVTVLNPSPHFQTDRNFVIRDYHSDICRIIPIFKYRKADNAKQSWCETNDSNRYTFLISLNERFYQVLAIYPKGTVKRIRFPTLAIPTSDEEIDLRATDVQEIISLIASSEQTSKRLKLVLGYSRFDELIAETEIVQLEEWLNICLKPYVRRLTIVSEDYMSSDDLLSSMEYGDMYVFLGGEEGLQFLLKTRSCCFLYTQMNTFTDIPFLQVFFDEVAAQSNSSTMKVIRLTTIIRYACRMLCRDDPPTRSSVVLDSGDIELHKRLIWIECRSTAALLDLDHL